MQAERFISFLRSPCFFLALGLFIRAPALWFPIEEGLRNAQTACLTANMIAEGKLRLDPVAPWRGDLQARLVQELPIYNLLVLALTSIVGVPLDLAGRLVSLLFCPPLGQSAFCSGPDGLVSLHRLHAGNTGAVSFLGLYFARPALRRPTHLAKSCRVHPCGAPGPAGEIPRLRTSRAVFCSSGRRPPRVASPV